MTEAASFDLMRGEVFVAGFVGIAAAAEDLLRRTVSNWLPLTALVGGIICQSMANGWPGFGSALLGAIAGFLVFLVFYVLGGMGGGDVKLMAGFGAILGISRLLTAAILTAILGGILAGIVLGVSAVRYRGRQDVKPPLAIPYAPAIVLGAWLTLLAGA
jgi:prepilin peptidase CpaA